MDERNIIAPLPKDHHPKVEAVVPIIRSKISQNVTIPKAAASSLALPKFHHDRLVGVRCPVCKRTFKNNALLKKHYGIHDGYYRCVCLICGLGFSKNHLLKTHKLKCHRHSAASSKEMICGKCGGRFDSKIRLQKHAELCICPRADSSPQCLFCTERFKSWFQLSGHYQKHVNRCSFCQEKLPSHAKFVEHMRSCSKNPLLKPLSKYTKLY